MLTILPAPAEHEGIPVVGQGTVLLNVAADKYPGVTLDSRVTWEAHLDSIATHTAKKVGALWRACRYLTLPSSIRFAVFVIMPDLLYALTAFSNCPKPPPPPQIQRLQILPRCQSCVQLPSYRFSIAVLGKDVLVQGGRVTEAECGQPGVALCSHTG